LNAAGTVPLMAERAHYAIGIDIGGTFTDIVFYDSVGGRHVNRKVLTTHDDPSTGVVDGIVATLAERMIDPGTVGRVVHATTLFTNALIERKGARTGMLTTAGFRDVLLMGRERKYDIYDIFIEMPEPVVPRHLTVEAPGRLGPDGREEIPLDIEAVLAGVGELVAQGVESLSIVFLHSYVNPDHERAAAAAITASFPQLSLSLSSDVVPEIREYERASTTAINAYVKPLAARYLDRLAGRLESLGIGAQLFMMLSNGGITHLSEAKRVPVQLLESGPAAGALAAAFFGAAAGQTRVLAFDMGGTTAKLSVVDDSAPLVAYSFEAARQKRFAEGSGLPVRISVIDLIEIGAGGGSIARIDPLGLLAVGPKSAGSQPGPAAYGRGGTAPTVTDADFLLGYLDPAYFAGGSMPIDLEAAREAVQPLAARTGLSITDTAWGIHDVVNENMASAARVHIAECGRDPRDYALLPTGGAGPVHAYYVAAKLGIRRIVCPPAAGVASALGLLIAPARIDRSVTFLARLDEADWDALEAAYGRLEADAASVIHASGLGDGSTSIQRLADLRYAGQGFDLVVTLPAGPYTARAFGPLTEAFENAYRRTFGRIQPSGAIEMTGIRVSATATATQDTLHLQGFDTPGAAEKGRRPVYFPESGGFRDTPVYDRYCLPVGATFEGPAVIEERESTLVIGPRARCTVDASGTLFVDLPEPAHQEPR
jgi:N-methylhydantoinase A